MMDLTSQLLYENGIHDYIWYRIHRRTEREVPSYIKSNLVKIMHLHHSAMKSDKKKMLDGLILYTVSIGSKSPPSVETSDFRSEIQCSTIILSEQLNRLNLDKETYTVYIMYLSYQLALRWIHEDNLIQKCEYLSNFVHYSIIHQHFSSINSQTSHSITSTLKRPIVQFCFLTLYLGLILLMFYWNSSSSLPSCYSSTK